MAEKPTEISDVSINDGLDALEKEKMDDNNMSLERKDSLKFKTLKKHGHLRVKEDGQTTYKRTSSSAIMAATQLGIGYSVGRLTAKQERDILMQDFSYVEKVWFPSAGSRETPSHRFIDFKFKSYAPSAFRYFRDLFGMQPSDFLMALSNEELRELSNPGASGSLFFLSADDNFIIKTVQHKEATFLQQLLPGYYMNLHQNPRTLLPKFFGLYCYQSQNTNIRLVVMNNILPTTFRCHQLYDLKGSTFKRKASKSELAKKTPTKKDLDFRNDYSEGITMEAETYDAVMKTIRRDCRVLESFKIMDYSLLLGIHNMDQALRDNDNISSGNDLHEEENPERVARRAEFGAALEAIQIDKVEGRPLGGIPAKSTKGDRLIIFLGIIDILQSYRIGKKLEHGWKSLIHDGDSVSVHNPSFYAKRFINFMGEKVFRKGQPGGRGSTKRRSVTRPTPNAGSFAGTARSRFNQNESFIESSSAEAATPKSKESKTRAVSVKFSEPTVIMDSEPEDQIIPPPYEDSRSHPKHEAESKSDHEHEAEPKSDHEHEAEPKSDLEHEAEPKSDHEHEAEPKSDHEHEAEPSTPHGHEAEVSTAHVPEAEPKSDHEHVAEQSAEMGTAQEQEVGPSFDPKGEVIAIEAAEGAKEATSGSVENREGHLVTTEIVTREIVTKAEPIIIITEDDSTHEITSSSSNEGTEIVHSETSLKKEDDEALINSKEVAESNEHLGTINTVTVVTRTVVTETGASATDREEVVVTANESQLHNHVGEGKTSISLGTNELKESNDASAEGQSSAVNGDSSKGDSVTGESSESDTVEGDINKHDSVIEDRNKGDSIKGNSSKGDIAKGDEASDEVESDVFQVTNIDTVISSSLEMPDIEVEGTTGKEGSGGVNKADIMVTIL